MDLENIIDYLHALGISTIYASPITTAVPGSLHGYDVIDPHGINPEIGTIDELRRIAKKLREKSMSWVQDIVPNHMAFSPLNARLMDVLERGPSSEYFHYFDINWNHPDPDLRGRVMVPILDDSVEACVAAKKIRLAFGEEEGFFIEYAGNRFPLSITAYVFLAENCDAGQEGFRALFLKCREDCWKHSGYNEWTETKLASQSSFARSIGELTEFLDHVNNHQDIFLRLLQHQYYVLTSWRETNRRINYRRFFTVNSLICLAMESEETFFDYHSFIHELYREGLIQGLRIDHIDGLNNPGVYTHRLRNLFGEECYIVAEKILESKERMPGHWPLQGTSGYEFLSPVSKVMTNVEGAKNLQAFYGRLVKDTPSYHEVVFGNKKKILYEHMQGELDNLVNFLFELGLVGAHPSRERLRQALGLFMICLPVYRLYPEQFPIPKDQLRLVDEAISQALLRKPQLKSELHLLRNLFEEKKPGSLTGGNKLKFIRRLMQFTGPLTAKGVEDTSFYTYNPLISHNEVGDSPGTPGIPVEEFHACMKLRQRNEPLTMNATATHDTKRGEDARMRINILSEISEQWMEKVAEWRKVNRPLRTMIGDVEAPSTNDEYFLYQSLVGGFPADLKVTGEFSERLKNYFIKVLREAKTHTSWDEPKEEYERACAAFIDGMLEEKHSFLRSFLPFLETILPVAAVYTLNQALIKITAPGIPDIYQGCELWDLSYVDPDNRRPVDFESRQRHLAELIGTVGEKQRKVLPGVSGHRLDFIAEHRTEGLEKLYYTLSALQLRKSNSRIFQQGEYVPLSATARYSVLSFARRLGDDWIITLAPINLLKHRDEHASWQDHHLLLPEGAPCNYLNRVTGQPVVAREGRIGLGELGGGVCWVVESLRS